VVSFSDINPDNIDGLWTGKENININPEFIEGDSLCHLSEKSLCMNTGIESLEINGTVYYSPATDFDGHDRPDPFYQLFDMGADEFYLLPDPPVAKVPNDVGTNYFMAWWEESSWAQGYYLDVSYDSDFTSFLQGYENLDVGDVTTYLIENLESIPYFYRLRAYNSAGTSDNSNTIDVINVEITELKPATCNLKFFPVPCSDNLTLHFTLHTSCFTVIDLYSIEGIMIKRLVNEEVIAGEHVMTVDLSDLPAGIYFVRLQAGNRLETARVVVTH